MGDNFADLSLDSGDFKLACFNIAQAIEKGETTLVNFVESVGPYLINKEPEKRLKGVAILSTILDYLPADKGVLDEGELMYMCAFLVDRLNDHHTVMPAVLKSILTLISFENFPAEGIRRIPSGIFQNVACQTQQPKDRLILYKIFDKFVQNYRKEILEMGPDFVYGILSSVENERNPENLLYLFNWYPKFCANINLGHLTDETFDILSCYFPVDYQPLNMQPNAISRDELADALGNCLYAIPEFGDQSIILALEKLSSDLLVAKLDSLKLLMYGTANFPAEIYFAHSTDILSSIKRQIYETDNNELKTLCCDTLTAISVKMTTLSKFDDILTDTYQMAQANLSPHDKYFAAGNLFLTAFSKGCQKAAEFLTKKIHEKLIIIETSDLKIKIDILRTLYVYTKILIKFDDGINTQLLQEIQNFFYNAAINTENEIIRTEGFYCLGLIAPHLTQDVKNNLLEILKVELTRENLSENNYKKALIRCFENIANAHPAEIDILIRESGEKIKNHAELTVYLEMIGLLVKFEKYTQIIVDLIINICGVNFEYSLAGVKQLRIIFNNQIDVKCKNRIITYLIHQQFLPKLITRSLLIINDLKQSKHEDFLTDLSLVVQTIIGHDSIENQRIIIDEFLPKIQSVQENACIILISSLLAKLKSNFDLNREQLSFFISKCFDATAKDEYLLNAAQELVANLINKCDNDAKVDDYLEYITRFSETFASNTKIMRNYNYNFVPLIAKALIMKGHPQCTVWINQMIVLLNNSDDIVNGFSVVLSDNIDCLSNSSYCIIRLFYKQRFFSQVSTILSENSNNDNYFKAFCVMLKNISNKIFALEFEKNLALILASLKKCKDIDALNALLKMLQNTINVEKEVIINNIDEILSELLNLFTFKNSMEIRILSIKCVEGFLIGYPVGKLIKQKSAILAVLRLCIDDKKRVVRKVAANSINKWFLYAEDF